MREKLRSVTSPHAAIQFSAGFGMAAKAGYDAIANAVAPSHWLVFLIVSIKS